MVWIVYVCFLVLKLSFVSSTVCAYTFGDSNGKQINRILAEKNRVLTIHGELTYNRVPQEQHDPNCERIDTSPIKPWYIWISPTGGQFYKNICKEHRAEDEDFGKYTARVINKCKIFQGKLQAIYCRVDEINQVNVILELILTDLPDVSIHRDGSDHRYSRFATPLNMETLEISQQKYLANVEEGTLSIMTPTARDTTKLVFVGAIPIMLMIQILLTHPLLIVLPRTLVVLFLWIMKIQHLLTGFV
ncbi:hypothetical protein RF11_08991 [Thelohanellus kitauei]|uniref:SHSP domain-containing protein n=1 Tax=Thelohanellus kitauei TaxID=669202 RepID=A0A0C2MEI0_THEKT|nr:hypothetical protein RF11_08991 [Thelohanellus kitauei]